MQDHLKDLYNPPFFERFSEVLKKAHPSFDHSRFCKLIFDQEWETRAFKQRIGHISLCLHETLGMNYMDGISLLKSIARQCRGLEYLFFPDYVEVYGLEDWERSMAALEQFTAFSSSEFAVRRFILHSPEHYAVSNDGLGSSSQPPCSKAG
ncbi:hypothetical protein [Salinithrix halophila]|uniref:Uncharacterized protein n=1 Tax=Salinithrix halophila TaxID=1485204 RepID=A0ABV8JLD4_9BACL